jgi:hypothetical protein
MNNFKQMLEMVQGMNDFQVQQTMETDAKTEVLQAVCDFVMSAIEDMQLTMDTQAKRIEVLEQGKPITAVGKGV